MDHRRPSRIRKVVVRAVLFLLLGAIVNVAVAWACATWISPVDAAIQFSVTPLGDGTSEAISAQVRFGHTRLDRCRAIEKRDAQGALRNIEVIKGRDERSETLAGWPLRALACANPAFVRIISWGRFGHMWSNPGADLTHGIELPPFMPGATATGPSWRALPYQPLWIGLIVNTLFYAAIVWLLLTAPFALRCWRRLKRGLCPACAYPVGTSQICTECGRPVTPRSLELRPR